MNAFSNAAVTDEATILQFCREEMAALLPEHSEYAAWLEDIDTHACSRGELVEAIRLAPSSAVRQSLHTIFCFREMLTLTLGSKFA